MIRPLLLACALLVAAPAGAQTLRARDTADVGEHGRWSVGVFNPLTYAIRDGVELQGFPLLFLASPNLLVRVAHGELGGFRLAGEYGASLPTPAMRLAQGYLFATWDKSDRQIGLFLVPRVGVVASRGNPASRVLTLRADVAWGAQLSDNDATAMDGVAPLQLLFAPALTGFRARAGAAYDVALSARWRARAYGDFWAHGKQPSWFTLSGGLGIDLAVGESSRFTFGAMWWNSDTHAIDAQMNPVRSNDFLPTVDFIWAG